MPRQKPIPIRNPALQLQLGLRTQRELGLYEVFSNLVELDDKEVADLKNIRSDEVGSGPIFNRGDVVVEEHAQFGDLRRAQYKIPAVHPILEKIKHALISKRFLLQSTIGHGDDDLMFGDAVLLRSEVGCSQQQWHRDFSTDALKKCSMRPIGVVLAIEDGARLSILGEPDVKLSRGDCLVFDGLCIHAGSAYPDAVNYRVHVYLDTREKSGARVQHETYLVDDSDVDQALRYNNEYFLRLRSAENTVGEGATNPPRTETDLTEDCPRKKHKMLSEKLVLAAETELKIEEAKPS
jgi:hypothetical protein